MRRKPDLLLILALILGLGIALSGYANNHVDELQGLGKNSSHLSALKP